MSGEWKGWQTWDIFEKAGIVENAVDFSEEAIIVDHAVGRTKRAIGKCWPMDAAVAYTLMKAGPNNPLKWADMVNTYTRAAAVMMTGKVGWGEVPTPSTPSCGHDEVTAYTHAIGYPTINSDSQIIFKTGYGSSTLRAWLDAQLEAGNVHEGQIIISDEEHKALVAKYCPIRLSKQTTITYLTLMQDSFFADLVALLQKVFGVKAQLGGNHTLSILKATKHTHGKCKWADDPTKTCRHHDRPTSRIWSMIRQNADEGDTDFKIAWRRAPTHSGGNHQQWNISNYKPAQVVAWDEMRRGMSQGIPESDVIKSIRESLARMMKREDNIVSKEGRGKNSLHAWSDWGWLAEMSAYVKNTSSKNRKEGDIENGWKYCKVRSRRSFGHEIADFVWRPVETIKDYLCGRKEPSDWSASGVLNTLRFSTKQQCIDFMAAVSQAHLDNGGHYANRTHDGLEKVENGEWSIRSVELSMTMHGRIDPEDYLTPQEVVAMWRNGAPAVLAEHKSNFEKSPSYTVKQAPPKTEGGD
ncbi:MAG: hypothetical protein CMI60_09050 [Parvibaculum sp.]|nr:hypothetical protein [Parvibaculum sp.]